MNELITVTLNDSHEPVVSGRQLHEAWRVLEPTDTEKHAAWSV